MRMTTFLATKIRRALQLLWSQLDKHLLPVIDDGIVLAISGGPDSRALLEAIATWKHRARGNFIVSTVNHGLREGAQKEAELVLGRARRLGFKARLLTLGVLQSHNEKDLREARLRLLMNVADEHGYRVIVTAHQRDDNAEGYMMALLGVGGGELGAAMNEIESFQRFILCRPFLSLTKAHLLSALTLMQQTDFVRDDLDEARVGKRALVRLEILPELAVRTHDVNARLQAFARAQKQQQTYIDQQASNLIIWTNDHHATIAIDTQLDVALLTSAIWQVVKKISDGGDVRSAKSTINHVAAILVATNRNMRTRAKPGLDRSSNGFNLEQLSVRQYQLPGAILFRHEREIVIRRVDPSSRNRKASARLIC